MKRQLVNDKLEAVERHYQDLGVRLNEFDLRLQQGLGDMFKEITPKVNTATPHLQMNCTVYSRQKI